MTGELFARDWITRPTDHLNWYTINGDDLPYGAELGVGNAETGVVFVIERGEGEEPWMVFETEIGEWRGGKMIDTSYHSNFGEAERELWNRVGGMRSW